MLTSVQLQKHVTLIYCTCNFYFLGEVLKQDNIVK